MKVKARRAGKATYSFRAGSRLDSKKAQEVGEELFAIGRDRGIRGITAETVLEYARDPLSVLHSLFEWNDGEAAEKWRLHQARNILNCITVTYSNVGDPEPVNFRAFVHLQEKDEGDDPAEYLPTTAVMQNDVLRRRYLKQAKREALNWRRRYRDLIELSEIFEAIDRLRM